MASAEIIGAAIGILLMMIVAYLLVGSTLTAAEIVTTAQKDVTLQNEARMRTSIIIFNPTVNTAADPSFINFYLNNTGSEPISDFSHMDIFTSYLNAPGYQRYTYNTGGAVWTWKYDTINPDLIHPQVLDPGEVMYICVTYPFSNPKPNWTLVSTANGVYTSATVP